MVMEVVGEEGYYQRTSILNILKRQFNLKLKEIHLLLPPLFNHLHRLQLQIKRVIRQVLYMGQYKPIILLITKVILQPLMVLFLITVKIVTIQILR